RTRLGTASSLALVVLELVEHAAVEAIRGVAQGAPLDLDDDVVAHRLVLVLADVGTVLVHAVQRGAGASGRDVEGAALVDRRAVRVLLGDDALVAVEAADGEASLVVVVVAREHDVDLVGIEYGLPGAAKAQIGIVRAATAVE